MPTRRFPAICSRQVEGGHRLLLFSAPATDIDEWSGVPQKKGNAGDAETTGFQRDENAKRIESLVAFMKDNNNVIQNPLLCATQTDKFGKVEFRPDAGGEDDATQIGHVEIEVEDFTSNSLLELMRSVKDLLESRVSDLGRHTVHPDLVNDLKQQVDFIDDISPSDDSYDDNDGESDDADDADDADDDTESQEATEVVFSDESHILDFWHELSARVQILEEVEAPYNGQSFLGFTREAMISFLKPVVVMDGQHRLRGALLTAKRIANETPTHQQQMETAIELGEDPSEVQSRIEREASRLLPVSLLLSSDPAEHVFQFIVVNQKATPIGKALLGTIVSTTLSNDELTRVSNRLSAADIQLDQSRSVAYLSRNPFSPFKNRIETGMAGEAADRLAWSVAASLVKIFQKLKGGKLFGQKIDFADKWKRDCLASSEIVSDFSKKGFNSPFEYWSSQEGPWREVFIRFYSVVRKEFAKDDPESSSYWGAPKSSNVFNKISLTILAADFFQFLVERKYSIDSTDDVPRRVDDWLDGVSREYFSRDWRMTGAKKDGVGIRNNWAKLWADYRRDPVRMPKSSEYRKNL
jgi:hypothetical protein